MNLKKRSREQEDLQKFVTVRINVKRKDKDESDFGSGIIYSIPNNQYCLIITAKHCLLGKRNEDKTYPFTLLDVEEIIIEHRLVNDDVFKSLKAYRHNIICDETDLDRDIALIVVSKEDIISAFYDLKLIQELYSEGVINIASCSEIPSLKLCKSYRQNEVEYDSNGYPIIFKPKSHYLGFEYVASDRYNIEIQATSIAPSDGALAVDYIGGFSGSGVLIRNFNFLTGIVSSLKDPTGYLNTVIFVKVSDINRLLEGNSFGIPVQEFAELPRLDSSTKEKITENFSDKSIVDTIKNNDYGEINIDENLHSVGYIPSKIENKIIRVNLVNQLNELLVNNTFVNIQGKAGTGKTQLALEIYEKFNGGYWINFDMYKNVVNDFKESYQKVFNSIMSEGQKRTLVIIDSFPILSNSQKIEIIPLIENIKNELDKKNGRLLIVSRNDISKSFQDSLIKLNIEDYPITGAEILDYLEVGQGGNDLINKYSDIISKINDEAPFLVNELIVYLANNKWDIEKEKLPNLFIDEDIKNIRNNLNSYINNTLDIETKELLYRISLIWGYFDEKDIRLLGNISPKIDNTQKAFSRLKQSWVETVDSNRSFFKQSMLFAFVREEDIAKDTIKKVFKVLADNIIATQVLNILDVYKVMYYSYQIDNYNFVASMLVKVLTELEENSKLFYEYKFTDYWYYSEFSENIEIETKQIIRLLQTRIAITENRDEEVFFLINDLDKLTESAFANGSLEVYFVIFIITVSSKYNSSIANKWAVRLYEMDFNVSKFDFSPIEELLGGEDYKQSLFCSPLFHVKNIDDVYNWFGAYDKLQKLIDFSVYKDEFIVFAKVANALEELEKSKESPNWQKFITILEKIAKEAIKRQLFILWTECYRSILSVMISIQREFTYVQKYFTDLLEKNREYLPSFAINILTGIIGVEFSHQGEKEIAVKYLSKVANKEIDEILGIFKFEVGLVIDIYLSYRVNSDENIDTLGYSKKAYLLLKERNDFHIITSTKCIILGEHAIDLLSKDQWENSLYALEEAIELLLEFPEDDEIWKVMILKFGNTLNYVKSMLIDKSPPEKDIDGNPYDVPDRGYFMRKNMNLEYYFPERRLILALLLCAVFETQSDWKRALKWGRISYQNQDLIQHYHGILFSIIPFVIKDYLFIEASELFRDSHEKIDVQYKNRETYAKIAPHERIANYIKDRPIFSKYDLRSELAIVFIPALTEELSQVIDSSQKLINIENYVNYLSQKGSDNVIISISKLITLFYSRSISMEKIDALTKGVDNNHEFAIQYTGRLLYSVYNNVVDSFLSHISIMQSVERDYKQFKSLYEIIVLPYFISFWERKFNIAKKQFLFSERLEKDGFKKVLATPVDSRLSKLFQILKHHIDISELNISLEIMNWLDE